MSNENVADNIIKAIIGHGAIHRAGYDEGVKAERRKALAKLDEAWAEILSYAGGNDGADIDPDSVYANGIDACKVAALTIIERLGGMNPLKRSGE